MKIVLKQDHMSNWYGNIEDDTIGVLRTRC